MTVAAKGDARFRPLLADMAHKTAQMRAYFNATGRLARPQNDRNGTGARGVVDMDRQEAALVIMGIEQR